MASEGNTQVSHQNLLQKDIRQLDFSALRQAGYRGAVFDKDNCLVRGTSSRFTAYLTSVQTVPHHDTIVPELEVWLYISKFSLLDCSFSSRKHGANVEKHLERETL